MRLVWLIDSLISQSTAIVILSLAFCQATAFGQQCVKHDSLTSRPMLSHRGCSTTLLLIYWPVYLGNKSLGVVRVRTSKRHILEVIKVNRHFRPKM